MSESVAENSLLASSAIAAGMTPEHLQVLSKLAEYLTFEDGQIVMDDRDESHRLFVLLVGRASVQGTFEQEISIAEAGTVLGELSFLDGKPRSATVRSIGTSRYAVLSRELLGTLRKDHPEVLADVLFNISISLCTKLRSTLRMLNALSASL
jgi:CRP/FNR family transcriptional regulator, cyclic AMP receptor protein